MEQDIPKPFTKKVREVIATPLLILSVILFGVGALILGPWVLIHGKDDAMRYINKIMKDLKLPGADWPPKSPPNAGSGI